MCGCEIFSPPSPGFVFQLRSGGENTGALHALGNFGLCNFGGRRSHVSRLEAYPRPGLMANPAPEAVPVSPVFDGFGIGDAGVSAKGMAFAGIHLDHRPKAAIPVQPARHKARITAGAVFGAHLWHTAFHVDC